MNTLVKNNILGIGVTNATKEDVLKYILFGLEKKANALFVVTPNPEIIVFAQKNPSFKTLLNSADLALADGVGVTLSRKLLGKPFKQRITGVDMVNFLCEAVNEKPITVGFLGGRGGVAEQAAECLVSQYPNLKVVFTGSQWPYNHYNGYNNYKNYIPIDILFVAYGFPKQEEWMAAHKDTGIYRVALGIGGAFDYISGNVPRAPRLIRHFGGEWLYRLVVQPWRFRRQLSLVTFTWMVLQRLVKSRRK